MGFMSSGLRLRFWVQASCGAASGALAVLTFFWRDWIEAVFGADPDQGSGTAEWVAVGLLLAVALTLAVTARREWCRARTAAE